MATDDQATPRVRASEQDWAWVESAAPAYQAVSVRCLLDVRDRVAALEAASCPKAPIDDIPSLSELAEMFTAAARESTPTPAAAPAGGVTEAEMVEALEDFGLNDEIGSWQFPVASYLLNHPRIGPLLRGEGARRVVLSESPPVSELQAGCPTGNSLAEIYWGACHRTWAAARAEVARQQGEGV